MGHISESSWIVQTTLRDVHVYKPEWLTKRFKNQK